MVKNLKIIEETLSDLSKELDSQLNATSLDTVKFHEHLIELLSNYPDDKELIQFIVFINDRIVTNQELSKDIIYDTLKELIKQKQLLIKELLKNEEESSIDLISFFKENKLFLTVISISVAITILFIVFSLVPDKTIEVIKLIKAFI